MNEGRALAETMSIPFAEVSSQTGVGIDHLLETLLVGGRPPPDWSAAAGGAMQEISAIGAPVTDIVRQADTPPKPSHKSPPLASKQPAAKGRTGPLGPRNARGAPSADISAERMHARTEMERRERAFDRVDGLAQT